MPFTSNTVSVISTDLRAGLWKLTRSVVYEGREQTFAVPPGFGTDFATIPKPLRWLMGRTGAHTLAAVLHDWLVTEGIATGVVSHRDADGLFRRVLRESGTPAVQRWIMWAGVRYGSLAGGRRDGWWRDLPAVATITVLAAPFVLPPTLLALAGLALYALCEGCAKVCRAVCGRPR